MYHRFPVDNDLSTNLKHISYVIISDCLKHDTIAVHCFQRKLLQFLQSKLPVRQLIYYSDCAASQYKNRKNFLNLAYHEEDFGLKAEWHFFGTSHGKGPCDGVGGTVKRLVARPSLQRPYEGQIQTPQQLYEWAKINIPSVEFAFIRTEEVENEGDFLKDRFELSRQIAGTQKLHAFIPISRSKTELHVKEYSSLQTATKVRISNTPIEDFPCFDDINGFVTCAYDGKWWLAYVLEKLSRADEVKLKFLHPAGPSQSFTYPPQTDELIIPCKTLLTKVSPTTATGRTYSLTSKEMNNALTKLNFFSSN